MDLLHRPQELPSQICYLSRGIRRRRRGRRCEQLLGTLRGKERCWNLKEKAVDRPLENSLWRRLWTCL